MKKIILNEIEYELVKNYKDGFDSEELLKKYTDYFDIYDYIVGDWSYGKLRLKGFCEKENKINNNINNIDTFDKYIKENCAFDCRYFALKKIAKNRL